MFQLHRLTPQQVDCPREEFAIYLVKSTACASPASTAAISTDKPAPWRRYCRTDNSPLPGWSPVRQTRSIHSVSAVPVCLDRPLFLFAATDRWPCLARESRVANPAGFDC